jgi:hypothetical protein
MSGLPFLMAAEGRMNRENPRDSIRPLESVQLMEAAGVSGAELLALVQEYRTHGWLELDSHV